MNRVVVIGEDGVQTDVTEAVQVIWDALHNSMDWGSGFLSIEEVDSLSQLAYVTGMQTLEDADQQMNTYVASLVAGTCPTPGGDRSFEGAKGRRRTDIKRTGARQWTVTYGCGHQWAFDLDEERTTSKHQLDTPGDHRDSGERLAERGFALPESIVTGQPWATDSGIVIIPHAPDQDAL